MVKFEDLGVCDQLCRVCYAVGFKKATKIQACTIPHAIRGRDVIGYAQTGSGKTIAFVLPILQNLLKLKISFSALIVVPTRELAFQIGSQIEILGNIFGIRIAILVGGIQNSSQISLITREPHVVVSTPGRLVEHILKTRYFKIKKTVNLVLDEADRLLEMDFEKELNLILGELPKTKRCFLFSATMTTNINKLQKTNMINPIRVSVHKKYKPVSTLFQNYLFVPLKFKECYFVFLCNEFHGSSILGFVDTQKCAEKLALLLKFTGFKVSCIHGGVPQLKRIEILRHFKLKEIKILISTDLASRGLDIPGVDLVINYDIPCYVKDYIHRIGRTARAGKSGRVINLISQYDIRSCLKIEALLEIKFKELKHNSNQVILLGECIQKVKEKVSMVFQIKKN
mmetsp:Transcript_11850/g.24418  ORF Transcript_11850/g.24418 Transcript_11850/m.24418 type:complete len:398 (+) Transcript_11850:884-2077(+)